MKITAPSRLLPLAALALSLVAASSARSQTVLYSDDLKANGTTRIAGTTYLDNNPIQNVAPGLAGSSTNWYGFAETYGWGDIKFQNGGVQQGAQVPFGSNSQGQGALLIPTVAQNQPITVQISTLVADSPSWVYFGNTIGDRLPNMLVGGFLNSSGGWGLVHGQFSYTGPFLSGSLVDFDNSIDHTISLSLNPATSEVQFSIDGNDVSGWVASNITDVGNTGIAKSAGFAIQQVGASDNLVSDFTLTGVPEPSTVVLLLGAAAFIAFRYRSRLSRLG